MTEIIELARKCEAIEIGYGEGYEREFTFDESKLTKFAQLLQQGEAVATLALKNTELNKHISVLEDLLSSAYNIANRNGENTHWERFAGQLHIHGINPVTPKTFKILPSDENYTTPPATQQKLDKAREDLQKFVNDASNVDLGGGDAVVTTCESLEIAQQALKDTE